MKKIFIYAYTQNNLGDDLFIKILCERYPQHQFYIKARKSCSKAFSQIKNLKVIYSVPYLDSILSRLQITHLSEKRTVKKSDMVVYIGGSIFIEPSNWENHLNRFKKRMEQNKPFYVMGSNFGPFTSSEFYEGYKNIYKQLEDICFRDHYSYNLFKELKNVRKAPDVVYTLNFEKQMKKSESNTVVISVIDLNNREKLVKDKEIYEEKIKDLSIKLTEKGQKVLLMSFCEREGDLEAIHRIHSKLPKNIKNHVNVYNYTGDLNESLEIIKNSRGVVATRFHSLILAWLFELPVFPIIYSSKTKNVLNDTNFEEKSSWIHDINKISSAEIITQILSEEKHDVKKEMNEAEKQFLKLDQKLKK